MCSTIGDRILKLRKDLGLTQAAFGEQLGVSQRHISQIEKGTRNASEQLVKHLCLRFNTSESWLLTGTGEMFLPLEEVIKNTLTVFGAQNYYEALKNILDEQELVILFDSLAYRSGAKTTDLDLQHMLSFLVNLWSVGDDKLKGWALVQFERAFPWDITEKVQKKIAEKQEQGHLALTPSPVDSCHSRKKQSTKLT